MVKKSSRKKQRTGKRAPKKYSIKGQKRVRKMKKKNTKRRLIGGG